LGGSATYVLGFLRLLGKLLQAWPSPYDNWLSALVFSLTFLFLSFSVS